MPSGLCMCSVYVDVAVSQNTQPTCSSKLGKLVCLILGICCVQKGLCAVFCYFFYFVFSSHPLDAKRKLKMGTKSRYNKITVALG